MSYYTQFRLENALPKALDLEKVGKPQDAYNLLLQCLTAKNRNRVWSSILEEAVLKFLELSIKQRSSPTEVRNVLSNFKVSTLGSANTASNPGSFAKAVRFLIATAEKATIPFIAQSLEIEEESEKSPEALAQFAFNRDAAEEVGTVRGSKTLQENRFLWEVYRASLELVKNNYKTFTLYHEVLRSIFATCSTYKRPLEFRRFTGLVRENHSSTAQIVNQLTDPQQVQDVYLSSLVTRLHQLDTAYKLEVWGETSNTLMDIHDLVKTMPPMSVSASPTLALIYNHLINYFWSSKNYLLHAYALWKLYTIMVNSPDLQQQLASSPSSVGTGSGSDHSGKDGATTSPIYVAWHTSEASTVLSGVYLSLTLALSLTPPEPLHSSLAPVKGIYHVLHPVTLHTTTDVNMIGSTISTSSNTRFNALFGFSEHVEPTPHHLLSLITMGMNSTDITAIVPSYILQLLSISQGQMSPLKVNRVVSPYLQQIQQHAIFSTYNDILNIALLRAITFGISNLYNTITVAKFQQIIPSALTWTQVEKILSTLSLQNELFIHINHYNNTISFLPSPHQFSTHAVSLANVYIALSQDVAPIVDGTADARRKERLLVTTALAENIPNDIADIRDKHQSLVDKRESVERAFREAEERKEREAKLLLEQKQREEEQRRLEEEERQRKLEVEREEQERQQLKKQQIIDALAKSVQTTEAQDLLKKKDFRRAAALTAKSNASEQELIEAARQVELQKRQEAQRVKVEERKTVDYLVRALRDTQRAKLQATYDDEVKQLSETYNERVDAAVKKHKEDYEANIAEKRRLQVIQPSSETFREKILAKRRDQLAKEMEEYEVARAAYEEAKKKRDEERKKREEKQRQEEEERLRIEAEEEAERLRLEEEEEQRQYEQQQRERQQQQQREYGAASKFMSRSSGDGDGFTRFGNARRAGGDNANTGSSSSSTPGKTGGTSWLLKRATEKQ